MLDFSKMKSTNRKEKVNRADWDKSVECIVTDLSDHEAWKQVYNCALAKGSNSLIYSF